MATLKSTAYLFYWHIPSVYCCVRAPVSWIPSHSFSQLIPRFDWSCLGCGRSAGIQLLSVHQTFTWHLLSHLQPPNILRSLGELAHFLLVSPLLCSSPFKEVWNPLCTEDSYVQKFSLSLRVYTVFAPLDHWRKVSGGRREVNVRSECLVGSLGRLVISLFFSCAGSLLWCTVFSCHRAWASVVWACRLRSCSWWALECSSADVAHGLCDSSTRGIFQGQGLNPWPLHWLADFYSLCHQGRPGGWVLISVIWVVPHQNVDFLLSLGLKFYILFKKKIIVNLISLYLFILVKPTCCKKKIWKQKWTNNGSLMAQCGQSLRGSRIKAGREIKAMRPNSVP